MRKRAQAALEFLITYGWAFLVILVMISALAYFGVLRPSKLLPDRCNFGSEIGCLDFSITSPTSVPASAFNLRLKNNLGEAIVVEKVITDIVVSSDSSTKFACTARNVDGVTTDIAYTWNTDKVIDMAFTSCNPAASGYVLGEKAKATLTIKYHLAKSSTSYYRQVAGEVFTTVT